MRSPKVKRAPSIGSPWRNMRYILSESQVREERTETISFGLLSCSMLVVNNLRDIPTDAVAGKRTLAVLLGDWRTRLLYTGCMAGAFVCVPVVAIARPWAMLALASGLWAIAPSSRVLRGAKGPELIAVLGETGRLQIVFGALFTLGLAV